MLNRTVNLIGCPVEMEGAETAKTPQILSSSKNLRRCWPGGISPRNPLVGGHTVNLIGRPGAMVDVESEKTVIIGSRKKSSSVFNKGNISAFHLLKHTVNLIGGVWGTC